MLPQFEGMSKLEDESRNDTEFDQEAKRDRRNQVLFNLLETAKAGIEEGHPDQMVAAFLSSALAILLGNADG